MKTALKFAVALYLSASLLFSAGYAISPDKPDFVQKRRGLLCASIENSRFCLFSPFTSAEDVFLLVVDVSDGVRIASDGLYMIGK